MPIPLGEWNVVVDGAQGLLRVNNVNAEGDFFGNIDVGGHSQPFYGKWNEAAQQVGFWVRWGISNPNTPEQSVQTLANARHFVGYLMRTPPQPTPGEDVTCTLTGYFDAGPATGGSRRREQFGW